MLKKHLIGLAIGLFMFGAVGMANATLYNVSKLTDSRGFDVNGYIEFSDNYYYSRAPSVGDGGALYPWVSSDIISWFWTLTIYDTSLLDQGYESEYQKSGNGGSIQFHNDINDSSRPGDGFLVAFSLGLSGSNISFYDNDLDRTWNSPKYDMGIVGSYPDYTKTNTFEFDVFSDVFSDGRQLGNYSINLTQVPVPAAVWLFGSGLIGLIGCVRCKVLINEQN